MIYKRKQFGVTLTEMAVVMGIVALLVGLTIPAVNMLFNSFESESGAKSMISAALASARAIAAKEQRYAGIRFQKRYDPNNPDPLNQSQYIIFIIKIAGKRPNSLAYGFRAVDGIQPIKLPNSIGVMDLRFNSGLGDGTADNDTEFTNSNIFRDITTFSIIFSPAGKLVIHDVRVRNRDEMGDYASYGESGDDIFNKKWKVDSGLALFYQDDYYGDNAYPNLGLGQESSRNGFYIYETKKFKQARESGNPWTGYLQFVALKPIYINPYTGTLVNE